MFVGCPLDKIILKGWTTSGLTSMDQMFARSGSRLLEVDLSGWNTRSLSSGQAAFPATLSVLHLGKDTRLDPSYFADEPSKGGAVESAGFTGHWIRSDGKWETETDDELGTDNEQLADLTNLRRFKGGTFGWQQFVEVSFEKNAPTGVEVSGDPVKVREVGFDASALKVVVPAPMFNAKNYRCSGWNTLANGLGAGYVQGSTITGLTRGTKMPLYAQWRSSSVPHTPVEPLPIRYKVRYVANAPTGLVATGSVPDDQFEVSPPFKGVNLLHYSHKVTASLYQVEGYRFVGWDLRADGGGASYQPGEEVLLMPGVTILYARWARSTTPISPLPVQYRVRYVANEPAGLSATGSVADDVFQVDPPFKGVDLLRRERATVENRYQVVGYRFAGWNSRADGTGASYIPGARLSLMPGVTTLYAQWAKPSSPVEPLPVEYRVRYVANEPAGLSATGSVADDVFRVDPPYKGSDLVNRARKVSGNSYVLDGYRFTGWNTKADGKGVSYRPGVEASLMPGVTTLYAQWAKVVAPSAPSIPAKPSPSVPSAASSASPLPRMAGDNGGLAKTGASIATMLFMSILLLVSASLLLLGRRNRSSNGRSNLVKR
ncbi:putative cell wall/surface protein [Bifidobacterium bohemicum DSM 22767]|uniref:Putative cell wall/surface protein n=2 Tax=Bifidobacterium bohemicum TaxID=638617 RepID=A0A086ZER4_9BIFI|nr:putative cell wall/surface protein [Bifidobacterium bohemicum DSM 22767]